MRVAVLGAGAWGTALAIAASRVPTPPAEAAHQVVLWARDPHQAAQMQASRTNARYLPGAELPAALTVMSGGLDALTGQLAQQDLIVLGTPMAALRSMLTALSTLPVPVVWLCKGFEHPDAVADSPGWLGHEIAAQVAPDLRVGILSGPSFAKEVAAAAPTALVAASVHACVRQAMVMAFHSQVLRVYASDDVPGVEVGGAVKNVMAIATGLCDGLQLGLNARAALITRGLAEMVRLGVALGARPDTFMGLTGLGDLVLTATGDLSRNRQVGLMLAQGLSLQDAVHSLGHVAEGVYSARTVARRARLLGVDMPITEAVVALLDGELKPMDALAQLMGREPVAESH